MRCFVFACGGWPVGAGAEWVLTFAPGWTAFVEWDHYDFGTKAAHFSALSVFPTIGSGRFFFTLDIKQQIETGRVGLNYRFN